MRSALLLALVFACRAVAQEIAPPPSPGSVETTVLLVGDAGDPGPSMLDALTRIAALDHERGLVVFLGDNVYPNGLVAEGDPGRCEAERRLDAQVDVAERAAVRTIFLAGNHDWARQGPDGWASVRRQGQHVAARATRPYVAPACGVVYPPWSTAFVPAGGCPGPVLLDLGPHLRLVFLDTSWWLQQGAKPRHPSSTCPYDSPDEVLDALRVAVAGAGGRHVAVLAHHPLATGGPHGGTFTARDHLFPLTRKLPWLWLPLPLVGSIYPAARNLGVSDQDLTGKGNKAMREALEGALGKNPPLLYVSGHEHALEVIDGVGPRPAYRTHLVSGAGSVGELSEVRPVERTRFLASRPGFMRLEVTRGGGVRLGVWTVEGERVSEVYSRWLAER